MDILISYLLYLALKACFMIYRIFQPGPEVQQYVKFYHLLHFNFKGSTVNPARAYFPQAEQCLTFDPRGRITAINRQTGEKQHRSFSYLSQQQTSTYDLAFEEDYLMLKIVFRPGALYRILGIPLKELGEKYVDASLIIPSEMRLVNEQLVNASSYADMIRIVERYLLEKTRRGTFASHTVDLVTELLNDASTAFSLKTIAEQAHLSKRQLERKYLERLGVSPMTYHRILRFNRAYRLKEANPNWSWFRIAIECDYSDLQHLIKDFGLLSGGTPSALLYEQQNAVQRKLNLV